MSNYRWRKVVVTCFLVLGFGLFTIHGALCATLTINNGTPQTYSTITIDSSGCVSITTGSPPPPTGDTITGRVSTTYNSTTLGLTTVGVPSVSMQLTGGATATSDSNGYYTFSSLTDGPYTVAASKTNYTFSATTTLPVSVAGNQTATVNFSATPSPTFSISGNVKDKTGAPFPGVAVELWIGATRLDNADITDTSGNYTIPGLANGITTPCSR